MERCAVNDFQVNWVELNSNKQNQPQQKGNVEWARTWPVVCKAFVKNKLKSDVGVGNMILVVSGILTL